MEDELSNSTKNGILYLEDEMDKVCMLRCRWREEVYYFKLKNVVCGILKEFIREALDLDVTTRNRLNYQLHRFLTHSLGNTME